MIHKILYIEGRFWWLLLKILNSRRLWFISKSIGGNGGCCGNSNNLLKGVFVKLVLFVENNLDKEDVKCIKLQEDFYPCLSLQ